MRCLRPLIEGLLDTDSPGAVCQSRLSKKCVRVMCVMCAMSKRNRFEESSRKCGGRFVPSCFLDSCLAVFRV